MTGTTAPLWFAFLSTLAWNCLFIDSVSKQAPPSHSSSLTAGAVLSPSPPTPGITGLHIYKSRKIPEGQERHQVLLRQYLASCMRLIYLACICSNQ